MPFDPARPFILFDDARQGGPVRLYANEIGRERAIDVKDVNPALDRLRAALAEGRHVAGTLAYEAGGAFEPRMAHDWPEGGNGNGPLLDFGIYASAEHMSWPDIEAMVAGRGVDIAPMRPDISEAQHAARVHRILDLIDAGDIYQANLTLMMESRLGGHPLALYARLRAAQAMPHGAVAHLGGGRWILSASPELFFTIEAGRITARPMKGTAQRETSVAADAAAAAALQRDTKNRAENLMITDLIRNDLSRVAAAGSVGVVDPFAVETYPTLHTMVTTVTADLAANRDAIDVIRAMFPCGSITGAPKVRAGQIISEVEGRRRGIYTGSIGWMAPEGSEPRASFNVAIRTLDLDGERILMGVGAGIVADSDPAAEWQETLTKAEFLDRAAAVRPFHLIETMRFHPDEGMALLGYHMQRLAASAERLDFTCNHHEIRNFLQVLVGRETRPRRVKLTLARDGAHAISITDLPATSVPMDVVVMPLPVDADDWRLSHKVSDRDFYDEPRRNAGTDEVLFHRPDGLLTEGSFTSLFVKRDGRLLTPRLETGLLPGVLRADLIERGDAIEADLTADDLDGEIFVGNALRGLVPAVLVARRKDAA